MQNCTQFNVCIAFGDKQSKYIEEILRGSYRRARAHSFRLIVAHWMKWGDEGLGLRGCCCKRVRRAEKRHKTRGRRKRDEERENGPGKASVHWCFWQVDELNNRKSSRGVHQISILNAHPRPTESPSFLYIYITLGILYNRTHKTRICASKTCTYLYVGA